MDRRALLLTALSALTASGCLCSMVIEPDPALLSGEGEGEIDCDDGIACTFDRTVEGNCAHEPDRGVCGEGRTCMPGSGCVALRPCERDEDCDDADPCTQDRCDRDRGACAIATQVDCDDGIFCNGDEICDPAGGCLPAVAPRDCRDAFDCTDDSCDEDADACVHTPHDEICDDGRACNGSELCDELAGCQTGAPACPDDGDCATEHCLEAVAGTAHCVSTPDHTACAAGSVCVASGGGWACDAVGCSRDRDCDDGEDCNGVETCGAGDVCAPGTPLPCDDGVLCNGVEVCEDGVCTDGVPPSCDDGAACTTDTCDAGDDRCVHDPDDGACDDGTFCNGVEVCAAGGCGPAEAVACASDDVCEPHACDEETDACVAAPATESCNGIDDDCNGTVDDGLDCALGTARACTADCSGAVGLQLCGGDCSWTDCVVVEDCNGVDDDCDGSIDEDCSSCEPGTAVPCTTTCSSRGTHVCDDAGAWGPCRPPVEVCDGLDDDCDGTVDGDVCP